MTSNDYQKRLSRIKKVVRSAYKDLAEHFPFESLLPGTVISAHGFIMIDGEKIGEISLKVDLD